MSDRYVMTWCGRRLEDLSKDELIIVIDTTARVRDVERTAQVVERAASMHRVSRGAYRFAVIVGAMCGFGIGWLLHG